MIKVDIVSGFLGAGKTTLIKKFIKEALYKEKIVIIENEFGEIGIDGSILKQYNLDVKEINAGCICCSIQGDFKKALIEIIDRYKPERIVIEPSGVAKLSEVIEVVKAKELTNMLKLNMVITVVDVLKYRAYINNFLEFYKDQVISAKTIVLSRTQNLDNKKITDIYEEIRKLNSRGNVITTPWSSIGSDKIIEIGEGKDEGIVNKKINILKGSLAFKSMAHRTSEVFENWSVETPKKFTKEALIDILYKLKNEKSFGVVLRAKGIVQLKDDNWVQFDYVPDEMGLQTIEADYSGRLCVIGSRLNRDNIKNLFLS